MRVAITFLTCDRVEYSRRTLETLAAHNDLSKFVLLHGDDWSRDDSGGEYARALGFRTVAQSRNGRYGVARMTEVLFEKALREGCDVVLNLQNDWECMRPIPVATIEEALADERVYCVRLYGAMKSPTGRCGIHHGGREPRRVVEWSQSAIPGWEIGDIHWGHPPAVTRIDDAIALTKSARTESVSRKRSGKITRLTVRPVANVFNHIGRERTPGFVA
jgi:hypothetical protein